MEKKTRKRHGPAIGEISDTPARVEEKDGLHRAAEY
jgi:hypothetical protein